MLNIHSFNSLQIHGKISQLARTNIINQFKNSGINGPCILVMLSMDQTGLNLPCANILVVLVRIILSILCFLIMADLNSLGYRIGSGLTAKIVNWKAAFSTTCSQSQFMFTMSSLLTPKTYF
jgi:hypothetical protein